MSVPLFLTPVAVADIQSIYDELYSIGSELSTKFATELRDVMARIEANPECAGHIWRNARAIRVGSFQYVVFYATRMTVRK